MFCCIILNFGPIIPTHLSFPVSLISQMPFRFNYPANSCRRISKNVHVKQCIQISVHIAKTTVQSLPLMKIMLNLVKFLNASSLKLSAHFLSLTV